jgi:hypothetical protein
VLLLFQFLLFLAALAGIVLGAVGAIFFAGGAFNRARPRAFRLRRLVFVALCLCAVVASAAGGFLGIAAIVYYAQI